VLLAVAVVVGQHDIKRPELPGGRAVTAGANHEKTRYGSCSEEPANGHHGHRTFPESLKHYHDHRPLASVQWLGKHVELRCRLLAPDHSLPVAVSPQIAGHDEQRLHLEALVARTQSIDVVLVSYIDHLLGRDHDLDRHLVVTPIAQHHQAAMHA